MKERELKFIINNDGCHISTSHGVNCKRYISTTKNGKSINLHRAVFLEKNGYLPEVVMHTLETCLILNS